MKKLITVSCFVCLCAIAARSQYPANVMAALLQTKTNRAELERALNTIYKSGDSLQIKAINFLVANMPIHNTYSYYWADTNGQRVAYNELNYPTFNEAVLAFNELKTKKGKLHPVPYSYRDIDSIKADYLVSNVEHACEMWRKNIAAGGGKSKYGEDQFLDYVLPYRVDVEEMTDWKQAYAIKFRNSFTGDMVNDSIRLRQFINDNFQNQYNIEVRSEPLPRLNALQILLRGKGYCEDMADMAVFAARSQGIPAAIDNIPAWATSTGRHFTNYLYFDNAHQHFDAALDSMIREPGKVVRTTYSMQPDAVASWLDTASIPYGFLRLRNYKDVTDQYWQTDDMTVNLLPNQTAKAVYVGVINGGNILPIWFAKKEGNTATFRKMCKGVVYFPFYFENGHAVLAGYPYALGYQSKMELKPDRANLHRIVLKEQEKYLKYQAGKHYQLLVWDNQWVLHSDQVARENATELIFENVPENALLLLRPEYTQGKERPFTILKTGERVWW